MALAEPDVAVIVAVPFATAVTRPDDETVATDEFDVAHVTDAPDIVAPFWSLTVAVSCCVTPTDEKDRLVTDSVIEVATGVGGAGGVGGVVGELPLSPHAASSSRDITLHSRYLEFFLGVWARIANKMQCGGYCALYLRRLIIGFIGADP